MGIKIITFTKRDGTPYTGAITFSGSYFYGRDSNGLNVINNCSAVDLGGGKVQVTVPSTDTLGVGYLVVPSTQIADISPRAQFVSDGPAVWLFAASNDPHMLPNSNLGVSGALCSYISATGAEVAVTPAGAGSIVDNNGNVLFSVLRFALPQGQPSYWEARSTGTHNLSNRYGEHGTGSLPAVPDGYAVKIIRFTQALNAGPGGAPWVGPLTFDTYPEFRRNRNGVKITPQIVDLGGGYVRVAMPHPEDVACACTVNVNATHAVYPRTHLVSMGSSVWLYGTESSPPRPNGFLTPSSVVVQVRKFGDAGNPITVPAAGAGGLTMSATLDDISYSVLRFDYPNATDSWMFTTTETGTTGVFPEAGERDLRPRVVYPEINYRAKKRWNGDGDNKVQYEAQWSNQFGTRGPYNAETLTYEDAGGGPITLLDGVPRIVTRRDEVYGPGRASTAMTVKYGDKHSNGARAEFVAKVSGSQGVSDAWFYEGDDVWISWATKFPADFKLNPGWSVWSQVHQNIPSQADPRPDNGGPMIAFTVNNSDDLQMLLQDGIYKGNHSISRKWLQKMQRGFWQHFLLHVKWSQNMSIGFQELWVDGQLAVPRVYHSNLDVDGVGYWKLGWYRNKTNTSEPQTIIHDDFMVWNSDPRIIGELPATVTANFSLGSFGVTALATNVDPVIPEVPVNPLPEIPVDWVVVAPSFFNRYEDGPFGDPKINGLEGPMFLLRPLLIATEPLYCIACSRADILAKLQFCWAHYEDYLNSKEYAAADKQTQGLVLSRLAFAERMRFQNRLPDIRLKTPIVPQ